jgi:hypothetical protein
LEYRPRLFSVAETAQLLGISRSYLSTLEREHALYARRSERSTRFYTAGDIAILRKMGVGERPGHLRSVDAARRELGLHAPFGMDPPEGEDSQEAKEHAQALKIIEEQEMERLRTVREEARRRRSQSWRG